MNRTKFTSATTIGDYTIAFFTLTKCYLVVITNDRQNRRIKTQPFKRFKGAYWYFNKESLRLREESEK